MGAGQPSRSAANDSHVTPCPGRRRTGLDPSPFESYFDDTEFDAFYGNSRFVDPQNAGPFTGGRTHSARELGEVVGLEELVNGFLPIVLVNEVVPFGYNVTQRT